jgi:hypothetical protein
MNSLELVKLQQRAIMSHRAEKRAMELDHLRAVIQRKRFHRTADFIIECIFGFQIFLVGAFVSALWYA